MDIIGQLPTELAVCILQYLSPKDLTSCCSVSKKWKGIAESNVLWKEHCIINGFTGCFPIPTRKRSVAMGHWRQRYYMEKKLWYNWKEDRYDKVEELLAITHPIGFLEQGAVCIFWSKNLLSLLCYDSRSRVQKAVYRLLTKPTVIISILGNIILIDTQESSCSFSLFKWSQGSLSYWKTLIYKGEGKFERFLKGKNLKWEDRRHRDWEKTGGSAANKGSTKVDAIVLGVLGSVVVLHSHVESSLIFWCTKECLLIAIIKICPGNPWFIFKTDKIYAVDHLRVKEFNSFGKETFEAHLEGEMEYVGEVQSNDEIVIIEGESCKTEKWISERVFVAWERIGENKNGRRIWKKSFDTHAFLLHPSKPLFYIIPMLFTAYFQLQAVDVRDWTIAWESLAKVLPSERTGMKIDLVGPSYSLLSVVLYKYHMSNYGIFRTERCLYDPIGGDQLLSSNVKGESQQLIWGSQTSLVFMSDICQKPDFLCCFYSYRI